jgi:hypothetical protein
MKDGDFTPNLLPGDPDSPTGDRRGVGPCIDRVCAPDGVCALSYR